MVLNMQGMPLKIDKKVLVGHEFEIDELRERISKFPIKNSPKAPEYIQLVSSSETDWDWDQVKTMLTQDPSTLTPLLFTLHFKRQYPFSFKVRNRILEFLSVAYQITRDVRYFNEFLWFYNGHQDFLALWLLTLDNFFKNLLPDNRHHFPMCNTEQLEKFLKEVMSKMEQSRTKNIDTNMLVGLIGSPTFFPKLRAELVRDGFSVKCYFIPYHPRKIINAVLRNRLAFFLIRFLKRAMFGFIRIDLDYKDSKIEKILQKDQLDIGFHKLGFIIKNNIIAGFRLGLLNDHWALLPFIRGRSTIEYSILFGAPMATTTHLITEKVDTGDIVSVYSYSEAIEGCSTVAEIRKVIRRDRDARAIDSIRQFSKTKTAIVENDERQGMTFFSIHPLLINFIDTHILQSATQ